MTFDKLLADSQADARSAVFPSPIKTFEGGENLLKILLLDPDAVVFGGDLPFCQ